jgi:dipeptidyl aminopeptidase/acylaminoacyl peptidase
MFKARQGIIVLMFFMLSFSVFNSRALGAVPYSVDLMLRNEFVGAVRISPDGNLVVFTVRGGGRPGDSATEHQGIYQITSASATPQALQGSEAGSIYELGQFSPSGRYFSFIRSKGTQRVLGILDVRTHAVREYPIWVLQGQNMRWLSDHRLALLGSDSPTYSVGYPRDLLERRSAAWRRRWQGEETTASAIGSGRYNTLFARQNGFLAIIDPSSNEVRRVSTGDFLTEGLYPSPDGEHVAVLRQGEWRALSDASGPFAKDGWYRYFRQKLEIYNVVTGRLEYASDGAQSVESFSPTWSEDSSRLAFFSEALPEQGARNADTADRMHLWTYMVADRDVREHDLGPVRLVSRNWEPDPDSGAPLVGGVQAQIAWLGHELAIFGTVSNGSDRSVSPTWLALSENNPPLNLLSRFGSTNPEPIAVHANELIVRASDGIWRVDRNAERRLLVAFNADQSLLRGERPWDRGYSLYPLQGDLVIQSAAPAGRRLSFLNPDTGTQVELPLPDAGADSTVEAANPHVAIVRTEQNGAQSYAITRDSTASRFLMLNGHLQTVASAQVVPISTTRNDGTVLHSWLLLPPGYRRGDPPLPTVVRVYPTAWPRARLATPQTVNFINDQILPGLGYAVLVTDLPRPRRLGDALEREDSGAFTGHFTGMIDAIVDSAIATGFVDRDRLAIFGASGGGWLAMSAVTRSDRFKAVIADAGVYNWLSVWAEFSPDDTAMSEFGRLRAGGMFLQELKFWGTSGPPWTDLDRYLANSPFLHVESIHTPVMLIHGDNDYLVPFSQSEEMFSALWRLGKDVVFVRYWGEGHAIESPPNVRDFWTRVSAFLAEHIGPPFDVGARLASEPLPTNADRQTAAPTRH